MDLSEEHIVRWLAVDNLANSVLNDERFVLLDSEAPLTDEYSVLQLLVPLIPSLV